MNLLQESVHSPQISLSNSDLGVNIGKIPSKSLGYLELLRTKIEHIILNTNWKNEGELSLQLQKVIFKSKLSTSIRRRISGNIELILQKFPKISVEQKNDIQNQMLQVTENMEEFLQNNSPTVSEALFFNEVIPLHQLIHATIFGEISGFEAKQERLMEMDETNDYWFISLLEILEIKPLRQRDICLHRFCQILITSEVVPKELTQNIVHIWLLKYLLDAQKIKTYVPLSGEQRESYWLKNKSESFEIDNHFVGPRLTEKIITIQVQELSDVSGDFAWSVDVLVKKFDKFKREILVN